MAKNPGKPRGQQQSVGRSTLEAYVGIAIAVSQAVFPMTFLWKIGLISILAFIVADVLWRNEKSIHLRKCERFTISGFGVVLVFALSFNALVAEFIRENYFTADPNIMYFTEFGTTAEIIPTPNGPNKYVVRGWPGGFMTARGSLLGNIRDKYQLIGVLFHHSGDIDLKDEKLQGSSRRYDIPESDLSMKIVWSTVYPEQVILGLRPTFYALIAIPKDSVAKEYPYGSIRDAIKDNGILIQVQAGPP